MTESAPLEAILRQCAAAAPVPWYPKNAAAALGLTDEDLAAFVEQLRGGGLIARTDAVAGYGRGYVLTPAGAQALRDPGDLEWLRSGQIPPRKSSPAAGAPAEDAAALPERERAVRMSLLAPFTAYAIYALVGANAAVFLWGGYLGWRQGIKPDAFFQPSGRVAEILHTTGSIKATDLLPPGRGLVRLLTCCFVHFGLIHLAVNMISLYLVGPLLERMWGHVRFLVLYLVAGFGGSCAAMVLRPVGGAAALAGASGAVWGILTSMAVWVVLNRHYMPRRLFSSWGWQIAIAIAINVAITYFGSGYVSAEAHYGGGAVGAVCALLLHFTRFGPVAVRVVATAAVAALPVFGLWAVTHPARFNTDWEMLEMHERYLPRVQELEGEAAKLVPGAAADPLINKNPGRRDEEQLRRAVEGYGEAEAALRPAADLLRQVGPYRDPETEKARQVRLELVEARLDVFARNRRCLEAGKEWSRQDEDGREEAIRRVRDLEKEWNKLLQH